MSNSSVLASARLNLGGGLVDITALTALIGSSTAESLALGNKGAVGPVFAAITIFGALSVVKACIAAATPGWLRETLGVKSSETDSATGRSLDLVARYLRSRNRIGVAIGVSREAELVCVHSSTRYTSYYSANLSFSHRM
jgi:hypothetical protein